MHHKLLALAAAGLTFSLVSSAGAHTKWVDPPPRDTNGNIKTGPCGGIARTGTYKRYATGATIDVTFDEFIDHIGCFQVALSEANDANFKVLYQIDDPADMPGNRTAKVALPAGVSCEKCTLQVRQIMLGSLTCAGRKPGMATTAPPFADPATAGATATYYSCADVCIGATCPPIVPADAGSDAAASTDASTQPTDDGGPTTTRPDGGSSGDPVFNKPADDGGCATGGSGVCGLAGVGIAIGAVLRRRRRTSI
jgi:hypothetical protein